MPKFSGSFNSARPTIVSVSKVEQTIAGTNTTPQSDPSAPPISPVDSSSVVEQPKVTHQGGRYGTAKDALNRRRG